MKYKSIDIGCGPNKVEDALGIDIYPYPGVDQTVDLDHAPWPLPDNTFEQIYARHIIEHVADIKLFMNEIHRIAQHDAFVEIGTPHFSSIHSWQDPTHRWHLSSKWYKPFIEQYLSKQIPKYFHISTKITFPRNIRYLLPKLFIRFRGIYWWEKYYAFVYPARDILTVLQVKK